MFKTKPYLLSIFIFCFFSGLNAQSNSLACNGSGNEEVGGFSLCFDPDKAQIALDRNQWFSSTSAPAGAKPSEAYGYNFPAIETVYPCLDGLDVEDVIITITINSWSTNFPPALACCESYISGIFANLYSNCAYGTMCPVFGDGLTNFTNPGSGDCASSGEQLEYDPITNTFPLGLPYVSTVSCLSGTFGESQTLGIDIFANFIFENAAANGCSNCPQDVISQGYITIDFDVIYEYIYCSNELGADCRAINFDPIGPVCDSDGLVILPTSSLEGVAGTWSPSSFLDVSAAGGTTVSPVFTPSSGECAITPISIDIVVDECCSAEAGNLQPNNSYSICSDGGEFFDLQLAGDLDPLIPRNFSTENAYHFLLVDANGVIIDNSNNVNDLNFPPNTGTSPIDYCIFGLSYKIHPGLGAISNGTTTINFGSPNVLLDGDGNELDAVALVPGSCMELSSNCVSITVEAPNMAPMVMDINTCEGGDTEISPTGTGSNFNFYSDALLTNLLSSGTTYDPAPTGGTTTEIWVTEGNGNCQSAASMLTITIVDGADPGTDNTITICTDTNTSIDLIGSLGGTPEIGGLWSDDNSSGVDLIDPSNVDVSSLMADFYNFTYTIAATGGCPEVSATVTIDLGTIVNAGTANSINICSDAVTNVDFLASLNGNPQPNGTWVDEDASGLDLSDPTDVDLSNLMEGSYDFTYEVIAQGSCQDRNAILTINFEELPNVGTNGSASICEGGNTVLDLTAALNGQPSTGGTWMDFDAAGIDLSDPTSVDFAGVGSGDYIFTYTLEGTICDDQVSNVTVSIGAAPTAGTNGSNSICNDGSIVDLFNELNDNPDNIGSWSDDDSSGVDLTDPNNVDFDMVAAGDYTFTYSIAASGDCPAASASVTITVEDNPNAGMDSSISYCKGSNTTVDLIFQLGPNADTGGIWMDDNNAGIDLSDPSSIDLENIADGTYDFSYIINGGTTCNPATAIISIDITSMPNFGQDNSITICEGDTDSNDFYNLLNAAPNLSGNWIDNMQSGLDLNDPSSVDISMLEDGIYTFDYEILGTTDCPGGQSTLTIDIEVQGNAGTPSMDLEICQEDLNTINLFDLLTNEDQGGTWTESSTTPSTNSSFDATTASFNPAMQSPNTYSFDYSFPAGTVCTASNAQVIVNINPNPIVDLGMDINQCVGDGAINLDAGNTGAQFSWTVIPDDGNNGASTQSISINDISSQSNFLVNVTQNNCTATDEISINISELPTFVETAKECSLDLSTYFVNISSANNIILADQGTVIDNMDGTFTINGITTGLDLNITISNPVTNCENSFIISAPDCACPTIAPAQGTDLSICEDQNIPNLTASADPGLEINWYDDAAGTNLLNANSNTFTPTMAGTFYLEAFDQSTGCPSVLTPITLVINPLPTFAETDKTCSGDLSTYDVQLSTDGDLVSTSDGNVMNNGNGSFSITGIQAGLDITITIENSQTNCSNIFNVEAPDCACPTITPALGADESFCEGEDFPTLSATAESGLEINWYEDAAGTNLLLANSNTFTPTMAGTYYAEAFEQSSGCPAALTEINLVMNDLPTFIETDKFCSNDLTTYEVQLMTDGDLITSSLGNVIDNGGGSFTIDFITADQDITITIENTTTMCSNTFAITAPQCDCPTIELPIAMDVAFCNGADIPNLEASVENGLEVNWYDDAAGNNLVQGSSSSFQPTTIGTYYVEAFDPSSLCGSSLVAVVVAENTLPTFNEINKECSADLSTYLVTFESDGDLPQTSEGDLVDNMDGTFTISDIPTGMDIALSIENSATTCSEAFNITAPNCDCPVFELPTIETVCDDAGTPDDNLDDTFSYSISLNSVNLAPTYTIQGGDMQNGLEYDLTNGPFGNFLISDGPIILQILDDVNSDCGLTNFQIDPPASCSDCQVTVDAGETSELSCAVTETTLQGTASDPGQFNWTGPNGFIANNDANPLVTEAGTYTLTVVFDNGCSEMDEVEITLDPTIPTADAGMNQELNCSVSATILQGSASGLGQFNWAGPNGFIAEDDPNPTVTEPGIYTLEVLFTNGCTATDFVEITLDPTTPLADAGIELNLTCENPEVTLGGTNSSQGSQYEYLWTGPNGFSSTEQNPTTTLEGTYSFVVTDTQNNCVSEMSTVEVIDLRTVPLAEIIWLDEVLTCELLAINLEATTLNNSDDAIYTWSFDGNDIEASNYIANAPGIYTLTVTDPATGCSEMTEISIQQNRAEPMVEVPVPGNLDCINESIFVDLEEPSTNYVYEWFDAQGNSIGTSSQIEIQDPGEYLAIVLDESNGCSKNVTFILAQDITAPNADAGENLFLDCNDFTATLNGSSSSNNTSSIWTTDNGAFVTGTNSFQPIVNAPGDYTLMVTDDGNGCTSLAQVQVSEPDAPTNASISIDQPTCIQNFGNILIGPIEGGTSPYMYSIDNGALNNDPNFGNLQPDQYVVNVEDANGCLLETMVTIDPSTDLTIDIGEDQEILYGDSLLISSILNVDNSQIENVIWTATQNISCDNCLDPYLMPFVTGTYEIEITDEDGCIATDEITIIVRRDLSFYIPTVFSPNLDGINDLFTVYPGNTTSKINKLQVLDRWGEELYVNRNFQANENIGWDGFHKGKPMQIGIYIYVVEVEYLDGSIELFTGDLTLMK